MKKLFRNIPNDLLVFFIATSVIGLAAGLSSTVFSNYYKDVYNVNASMRGFIEFPRELPGLFCLVVIGVGSFLGDIRLAIIAQVFCFIGVLALGLLTPPFAVMLVFLFINSLGQHMYMPLNDSIGMSLVKDKSKMGMRLGQFRSVNTTFHLIAGLIVFFGFRYGFFTFKTQFKLIFIISASLFLIVLILFIVLNKVAETRTITKRSFRFVFKKEYKFYYILATLQGAQKQIMLVFGPWVLIEILGQGAATLSLLTIISSFLGIFFIRIIGKWIDRFGIKKLFVADALSFIVVYVLYGLLSSGFDKGTLALTGIPFLLACGLFVLDRMSMQMGIIRIVYLKRIVLDAADITPTLSTGISMDHIVAIICAYLGGLAWVAWGPQYVFFIAAALSLINLFIARIITVPDDSVEEQAVQET